MSENTIIVETVNGPVKGILKTSIVGESFYRFRGIPYAKPPIGDLRFKVSVNNTLWRRFVWTITFFDKDPQPVESWTDPVDATNQGPTSIGLNFITFTLNEGCSEDCLTLNVYTKEVGRLSFEQSPRY